MVVLSSFSLVVTRVIIMLQHGYIFFATELKKVVLHLHKFLKLLSYFLNDTEENNYHDLAKEVSISVSISIVQT